MVSAADLEQLPGLSTGEALDLRPLYPGSAARSRRDEGAGPRWRVAEVLEYLGEVRWLTLNDAGTRLTLEAASSHLPMWTEWGVRDLGHLIHSLGCTFLDRGRTRPRLAAVSEVPAPHEWPLAHIEEDVRV